MKKLLFLLICLAIYLNIVAQSPGSFNYQAVIRNASGNVLANEQVVIKLNILQGSASGSVVFSETWDIQTNNLGLVNLEVGSINSVEFAAVDWSAGPFFIATAVNDELLGTSQMLSVPYALYAKTAENVKNLNIAGNEDAFMNWDKDVTDDFNGEYQNLSGVPTNVSHFNNDAGYLTQDSITNINNSIANSITAEDTSNWNNKQEMISGLETIFDGWDKDTSDDFDGRFNSLIAKPTKLGYFLNDVGYISTEADGSTTNEIQAISISNDTIFLSDGGFVKLPSGTIEADPVYSAWDKTIGISITESQISDLQSYLTAEVDGSVTNEIELPTQTGNSGKMLTTDGSSPSWVDANIPNLTQVPDPVNDSDAANKKYVDSEISNLPSIPDLESVPDPTNSNDAANKEYVDQMLAEQFATAKFKEDAQAVATTPIDISSPQPFLQVIDGYQLIDGDRVLLTAQSDPANNRVWIARVNASWEIAEDFDQNIADEFKVGSTVMIQNGDSNKSSFWTATTVSLVNNVWEKRNDLNNYQAGNGIDIVDYSISTDLNWIESNLNIDADKITSGTLSNDRLPSDITVTTITADGGTINGDLDITGNISVDSISATKVTYPDTYWDDLQVNLSSVNLKNSKEPNWIVYKGGYILRFMENNEEGIYFTAQLPHSYKHGTDIEFHIHLVFPNGNAGDLDWTFTHSWANFGEDFPNETTVNQLVASPEDADRHSIGGIATIDGSGKKGSSLILCSLTRDARAANASDSYGSHVFMVALDFHFESDKPGSNNAIPD